MRPPSFIRSARLTCFGFIVAGACLIGLIGPERLDAQDAPRVQIGGPFTIPVFDERDRVIARLRGMRPELLPNNRYRLESVRLDYYDGEGGTNLIVFGTNCVYDAVAEAATSTNWLHILTGDRRLSVRGRGFTWSQTTSDLIISNEVKTTISDQPVSANAPTNRPTFIVADQVRLLSRSNQISYLGHVAVDDEDMRLTSSTLDILQGPQGGVSRITAGGGVEITNRRDGSRATSETARYDEEQGSVRLIGNPRWQDGEREGSADLFILDRRQNQVLAIGNARMKLPRVVPQEGGVFSPATARVDHDLPTTNATAFLEVLAEVITAQLPRTNGPIERVTAETNVVVIDRTAGSRAEAGKAVYDKSGQVQLSGRPVWKGKGNSSLRAELLSLDLVSRSLLAATNVLLRLPAAALDTAPGAESETSDTAPPTRVLEVWCDWLDYRDTWLQFGDQVHLEFVEAETVLGRIDCPVLSVLYSNRLERIIAKGGVEAEEFPVSHPGGKTVERTLDCEALDAAFGPDGELRRLRADGQVDAVQLDRWREPAPALMKRAECDALVAFFVGKSNQVDRVEAEGNVRLSQNDRVATSDRASYSGTDGRLRLTGNPVAEFPEGRVTEADALVWNSRTGAYRIEGRFKSRWKQAPLAAGLTNLIPEIELPPSE